MTAGTVRPVSENSSHDQATRAISSGRGANDRGLSVPIWATAVWELSLIHI